MSSANQHNQCHGPAADIVWPASGAARVAIEIDAKLAQPRDFGSCPRVGHAMPPPPHSNSVLGRVWLDHQRRPEVTPPPEQFGGQIVGSLRHPRPPDNSSTLPPRATRRTFPIDCGSAVGPPRHQMSAGGPDLRRHTARASFRSSSPRAAQTGSPANQDNSRILGSVGHASDRSFEHCRFVLPEPFLRGLRKDVPERSSLTGNELDLCTPQAFVDDFGIAAGCGKCRQQVVM